LGVITINIGMQNLPVYLYPNKINLLVDLDEGVKGAYNVMYQREIKIQKGLKNKVQLQFKNSDQKAIRILAVTTTSNFVSSNTFVLEVSNTASIALGMTPSINSTLTYFQAGTYVSEIGSGTVIINTQNPVYNPDIDQFLSPLLLDIDAGTPIKFNNSFTFNMFDSIDNSLLISKSIDILDDGITTATRGYALLTLTETDTRPLKPTAYTFGITQIDGEGANLATYSNTYYGINGTLHLTADMFPTPKPTIEISKWQLYYNSSTLRYNFYTGNLRSYPEQNQVTTLALYLNKFKGTILIQATLQNDPGTFANYATLATLTYTTPTTEVIYQNAVGSWSDVRVLWIPDSDGASNYYSPQMPGNPTPGTEYFPCGKVDKIQYRS
jgi:hypothetical protein